MGFQQLGAWHSAGYKCGAWQDVAWFEKPIAPYDQDPAPLRLHRRDPGGDAGGDPAAV